jgi:hypothetical protein
MVRGPKKPHEITRKIDAGAGKVANAPVAHRGDPLPALVDPQLALLEARSSFAETRPAAPPS